ncbi:MAG: ABATE domain-containing protein, partial [Ilumatobacteraceae bacterium]
RRPFEFTGKHVVADFVNTVNRRPDFTRDDLTEPADLAEWAVAAGLSTEEGRVKCSDGDAAQFRAAIALRETLYRVFGPIAAGDAPDLAAMAHLSRRGAQALRSAQWTCSQTGFRPQWELDSLDGICDVLADEASALLRSTTVGRVGACAGCGWLFVDVSRAGARRWCSMNVCGVRDKMHRYHRRQAMAAGIS